LLANKVGNQCSGYGKQVSSRSGKTQFSDLGQKRAYQGWVDLMSLAGGERMNDFMIHGSTQGNVQGGAVVWQICCTWFFWA